MPPGEYKTEEAKREISLIRQKMRDVRYEINNLRLLLVQIFGNADEGMLLREARELADQGRVRELHQIFQVFDRIDDLRNDVLNSFNKLLPVDDRFPPIPLSSVEAIGPRSWPSLVRALRSYQYQRP